MLRDIALKAPQNVTVILGDTGLLSDDPDTRLKRLSLTVNAGLDAMLLWDDMIMIHESDLQSSVNSPDQLAVVLDKSGGDIAAGWPMLDNIFYDTFAYRGLDGLMFSNHAPYHSEYTEHQIFEVSCVGSAWLFPAKPILDGVRCYTGACIELCAQFKKLGYRIFVDPELIIIQPREHFRSRSHANL